MINKDEITEILNLRKKGFSTYKIANITNHSRRIVSYHINKRLGKIMCIKKIDTSKILRNRVFLGEFLGIFSADGNYSNYGMKHTIRIFFSTKDERAYAKLIYNKFHIIFNKKPVWMENKKCITIQYHSKELKKILDHYLLWEGKKTYTIRLKKLCYDLSFLKGFVRGYFDSDGYSDKGHRQITMFTVSPKMAFQLSNILKKLGFYNKMYIKRKENRKDLHFVPLYGQNASRFLRFIKPNNKIRLREW